MRSEVYWIDGPWPGRLAIVPRPRGGDWLDDEVRSWRDSGLDVVVSLLTPDEVREFELEQEEAKSRSQGIQLCSFPIPDRGVPATRRRFITLIDRLKEALRSGKSVAVHCRQGIGRSALVAASLLVSEADDLDGAIARISSSRGRPVPDTVEQVDWVRDLGQTLASERSAVSSLH
jgi:protein-tyrosine phosphatase